MPAAIVTAAALLFGPWQTVTPQTLLDSVPEVVAVGLPGSVHPYQKTEIVGCPIKESGKTVGWSLNCFPSAPRGGIREAL